ncbi:serine hydrolase [Radicibacter daui]|uniref:serine hydrolase n=1 Tax=Radicibacter daui TaxID=3064829 RepID=UPI0040469BEF
MPLEEITKPSAPAVRRQRLPLMMRPERPSGTPPGTGARGRPAPLMPAIFSLAPPTAELAAAPPQSHRQKVCRLLAALFDTPRTGELYSSIETLEQIAPQVEALLREHGPLGEITPRDEERYSLHLAKAQLSVRLKLDAQGAISVALFDPPERLANFAEVLADLLSLPGQLSLRMERDGRQTHEVRTKGRPPAVGSAFKLGVLAAVQDKVRAGDVTWDTVLRLGEADRSLPGGILQDWPADTPLTLASLAQLMITGNDNTATDMLMHFVGRDAVAAKLGVEGPVPTTLEVFKLRDAATEELAGRWAEGDAATRLEVLERLAALPRPEPFALTGGDQRFESEWQVGPERLCRLLEETAGLSFFTAAGNAAAGDTPDEENGESAVGFSGGSELGALTYATRLVTRDARVHCVVVSWNAADGGEQDSDRFTLAYRSLLRVLREPALQ